MSVCIYLFNAFYVKHIEHFKEIVLYKNKVIKMPTNPTDSGSRLTI